MTQCRTCWFGLQRSGLLACLTRDSSELKLYDVQQSTTESAGLLIGAISTVTNLYFGVTHHTDSHDMCHGYFPGLFGQLFGSVEDSCEDYS